MRAMRDEVLGSAYEILAEIAIREHTTILLAGEQLFSQETPLGAGIKPDLTVGKSVDAPRVLIQIHHTNAERASEKKFWRNVGEFVDARLALGPETLIVTLAFDSGQKRRLSVASENLMDGFLEADRQPYGQELLALGARLAESFHSNKVPVALRLSHAQAILTGDDEAVATLGAFGKDIQAQVAQASAAGKTWFGVFEQVQKSRSAPRIPKRRLTTLRRALGRLLPIETEAELRSVLDSARNGTRIQWPEYLVAVGVARRSIGGTEFVPPMPASDGRGAKKLESDSAHEVAVMLHQFDDETIVGLWRRLRGVSPSLKQALAAIRNGNNLQSFHSFLLSKRIVLNDPQGLAQYLTECFQHPSRVGLVDFQIDEATSGVWLLEYLMTLIKCSTGRQQGYGYSRLDAEAGTALGTGIGPHLSLFVSRTKMLRTDILDAFSRALSKRLKDLSASWIADAEQAVAEMHLSGRFEDGVYKTAAFDPCLTLILDALGNRPHSRNKRTPTFLSSFMKAGAATCDTLLVGDVVIMWQSATHQGVDHKTKELVGRVGMLRVSRGADGQVTPMGIRKALLVIDGTWTQPQLDRLAAAGFDGIYYCDELDAMVKEHFA